MRGLALAALALMCVVYFGLAPRLLIWDDSVGYLVQAGGMAGLEPYRRPGDRTFGYAALLALALSTPWPGAVLVGLQLGIAVAALAGLGWFLGRFVVPLSVGAPGGHVWRAAISAFVAAGGLYGALHVLIASALTEVLFAALALAATLAAVWLVLPGRRVRRAPLEAGIVAFFGAAPIMVKPHWQIAAWLIGLAAGGWLAARVFDACGTRTALPRLLRASVAVAMPLVIVGLVGLPDRLLAARFSPDARALFGAKTAFCNHAHLVMGTLARRPAIALQDDPRFEEAFKARLGELIAAHGGGWRLLGFNGDLCSYDRALESLLSARFPTPDAQARFLLGSLGRVVMAEPLPYLRKVVVQLTHGVLWSFQRFGVHGRPGLEAFEEIRRTAPWAGRLAQGVMIAPEHGPFGEKVRADGTWVARVAQGSIGLVFQALTVVLVAIGVTSVLAPWWLWRRWAHERRVLFLALLALPLAIVGAHHALIALVHTFDVWRYGFNVYFVNLYLVGAGVLFWSAEVRVWRSIRA